MDKSEKNPLQKKNEQKQILIEDATMSAFGFTNPSEVQVKGGKK